MCLKELGAELPLMLRTPAVITLYLLWDNATVLKKTMRRDHLPVRPRLTPPMHRLLAMDRRKPGEHRPKRLLLGPYQRDPYVFHSLKMPHGGLDLPDGELIGHLTVEIHVEACQPLWDHTINLYLKGSDPKPHPFGPRMHWVAHHHWTLAEHLARLSTERHQSPCGCYVRQRSTFLPQPDLEELGPWYYAGKDEWV